MATHMKRELKQLFILLGLLLAIGVYLWLGSREVEKLVSNSSLFATSTPSHNENQVASSSLDEPEAESADAEAMADKEENRNREGYFLVTRVIDGDTVELENGQKVRYIGVNAPESVSPTKGVECFGKAASQYNADLVLDEYVRLEKDVSETDRYKRLLRYVYLEDGTFVNLKIAEDGYAFAATFPPDVWYSEVFKAAQAEARAAGRGLWSECK